MTYNSKNIKKLRELFDNFNWQEAREGVDRESRARIVLLGLSGAGKSTLLNQLCGWEVSEPRVKTGAKAVQLIGRQTEPFEDFGLFCLVDLPDHPEETNRFDFGDPQAINGYRFDERLTDPDPSGHFEPPPLDWLDPLGLAEGADLLVYVLDGSVGVQAADYRWVGRLRRLGIPLLVIFNKADLVTVDLAQQSALAGQRLATKILTMSAQEDRGATQLLSKMINICPNLIVALGRELGSFRPQAAERLIQQAALINGLVALEPIPLIDLPVQVMTLAGLILRLAAVYDRPPSEVRRREVIAAVLGGLAGRYAAQQAAKMVPVVGWLVSSIIGWSCTWSLGRAAIAYFEADGDAAV